MTQDLVPQDLVNGPLATPGSFDSMVTGGDYLPRLQLFGSKSDACAEGKIGIGHYGLVKDETITDLGVEIDIAIISWRSKAVQIDGDNVVVDHKPEIDKDGNITNPVFNKIVQLSRVKNSGCMYGPEFLVWIPNARVFAIYHMNSKTARREAKNMEPLLGKAATLKCHLIDNGRYKWHGPIVIPCSAPIEMPSEDKIRSEWTKFQNPPENDIETVEEENENRAR